jgi:hypothetical protein
MRRLTIATTLTALPALMLAGVTFLPAPLSAQTARTFSLPAGCTGHLTVQTRSCTVSHHFTCEGDPEGWQRRVDMDVDGVTYIGTIDAETQWMESFHVYTGHTETLENAPRDRASLSALISEGTDTYDFQTLSEEIGATHYVGFDTLTGVTQEIDGVTLDQTEYQITAYDTGGGVMWESKGNEWISRDFRMFLSGVSTITTPDGSFETDDSPVEFIMPGEPGFLSVNPKHGCGETVSSLPSGALMPASFEVAE